jgi:flagellar protein FlgJ
MIGASVIANSLNSQSQRDQQLDTTIKGLQRSANGELTRESAKKVSIEFEGLFISQMLEHMFSGESLGESLFGNGETDEIYKSMMVEQYSKAIVKSGGIGIADYIERSLNERALLIAQEV